MFRKRLLLTSVLAILCLSILAISLHSPLVSAASRTNTSRSIAAHPSDLVKNNIYLITGSTFITALNATSGATLWHFQPGGYVDPPVLVNHIVYTLVLNAGTTTLYALNATSGATLWKFAPSGYFVNVPVVRNVVYLTVDSANSNSSILYALNATSGTTLWSFTSNATLGTPVISHNILYIGTTSATTVFAFNASTGKQIWHSTPSAFPISFGTVANGILYGDSQGPNNTFGILYAYRISDGTFLWSFQGAAWAEVGKIVYVEAGTYATPSICALNNSTGASLWCDQGGYAVQVVDGLAYVSTGSSGLQVFKGSTGALLWSSPKSQLLTATHKAVYVVDSTNAIDALKPADGTVLWRSQTTYGAGGLGFVVSNGTLYLTSADNRSVYALNAANGALRWHYVLPGASISFSVAHGEVFAVTAAGTIYALAANNGALLWKH